MPINAFPINTVLPTANIIGNTPFGPITATDVQAALNQLATLAGNTLGQPDRNPVTGAEYAPLTTSGPTNWKQTLTEIFSQMGPLVGSFTRGVSIITPSPAYTGTDTNRLMLNLDGRVYVQDLVQPAFANVTGIGIEFISRNADASYSTNSIAGSIGMDAKTTLACINMEHIANAGGQRFVRVEKIHGYGMGDCYFDSQIGDFACGNLPGDEGIGWRSSSRMYQQDTPTTATITSSFQAAGNTTTTAAITAQLAQVTVTVASTANINVGEWYCIERMRPSGPYNAEVVKIIAVGAGTITAQFRNNHNSGVTVTGALVLNDNFGNSGQLRVVVNRSHAGYSVGNIPAITGSPIINGSGTTWANNMVGGDIKNIGAISLVSDDYTATGLRSWYEIQSVINATSLVVHSYSVAGDTSYRSSRATFPTNYRIQPAVRILYIDVTNQKIVCETAPTPAVWAIGNTIEQAVCPYPDITGDPHAIACYTPGATFRSLAAVANQGPVPCLTGFSVFALDGASTDLGFGLYTGLKVTGSLVGLGINQPNGAVAVGNTPHAIEINGALANTDIFWGGSGVTINRNVYSGLSITYGGGTPVINTSVANTAINADTQLAALVLDSSWLNIIGVGNVANAYLKMDGATIAAQTDTNPVTPTAVEKAFGFRAFNFIPNTSTGYRFCTLHNQGFGTNGVLQTARLDLTLVNGANGVVPLATSASFIRVIGPGAAFSIAGIYQSGGWGPSSHVAGDGTELQIYNSTAFAMTILNDAAGGQGGFLTLTGADVTLRTGKSAATFKYSSSENRWILLGSN